MSGEGLQEDQQVRAEAAPHARSLRWHRSNRGGDDNHGAAEKERTDYGRHYWAGRRSDAQSTSAPIATIEDASRNVAPCAIAPLAIAHVPAAAEGNPA